jgi:uncharacterized metal-binding protein YceD (DUF177 family)
MTPEKLPPDIAPELSHVVPLSEIGGQRRNVNLSADDIQRGALARRFGLLSLARLEADLAYWSDGDAIRVEGRYIAEVEQSCVVTGTPVQAHIADDFALRFIGETEYAPDAEIELAGDDCETLFHDGRIVDVGEAVAQSLGLAIDPFPRSPSADATLREAGISDGHEAGPFAALAALRQKTD